MNLDGISFRAAEGSDRQTLQWLFVFLIAMFLDEFVVDFHIIHPNKIFEIVTPEEPPGGSF